MATIRELTAGEAQELERLISAVDEHVPAVADRNPEGLAAFLGDPSAFVLGAYVEQQPVGFAWGLQMRHPSGRLTTYLHQMEVHADWRRQGIATSLLTKAMELAKERGSTRFWLSTGGHNGGAQALYEGLGGDRKPRGDVNYWWQLG